MLGLQRQIYRFEREQSRRHDRKEALPYRAGSRFQILSRFEQSNFWCENGDKRRIGIENGRHRFDKNVARLGRPKSEEYYLYKVNKNY